MSHRNEDKFLSFKNPIVYGILGTVALFGIYVWLAASRSCQKGVCHTNYEHFLASSPNEIGDTLAGIAGILAFLWIITTVFLQSKELKIARQEYEKMANAQTGQLQLLEKQGKIFEDEQRQRDEVRAEKLLDEKLRSLIFTMSELPERGLVWVFSNDYIDDEHRGNGEIRTCTIGDRNDENLLIDEAMIVLRRRISRMYDNLWEILHQSADFRIPEKSELIPDLIKQIQDISGVTAELSAPQKERLSRMRLGEIIAKLNEINEKPEFWKEHWE